jgi:thiol-disulfide isomerase/thioredoxin
MTRRHLLAAASALAIRGIRAGVKLQEPDGSELVGHRAPSLNLSQWLNSAPLELGQGDLRGKVVLLRWWTEGCPFCEATAPALIRFQSKYQAQGLRVVGIYHPKPKPGSVDLDAVKQAAAEKHFTFPVAVDNDWTALKRWWLFHDRDFTSVSFLLDRHGVIRYVHPGGEFHEGNQGGMADHESCQRDYRTVESDIRRLLAEPA